MSESKPQQCGTRRPADPAQAEYVRRRRAEVKLTRGRFPRDADVSYHTVTNIELGRCSATPKMMAQITAAFDRLEEQQRKRELHKKLEPIITAQLGPPPPRWTPPAEPGDRAV